MLGRALDLTPCAPAMRARRAARAGSVLVVVDAFRASTTIAVLVSKGARVVPVASVCLAEDTVPVVPRLVGDAFVGWDSGSWRPCQTSARGPTQKAEISS